MGKFKDGDKVRYVGPPEEDGEGFRPGDIGEVLSADDHNGDAIITFEPSGAGVWSPKDQENLELADSP